MHFVDLTSVRAVRLTLCSYSVHFVDLTSGGAVKWTLCTLIAADPLASLPRAVAVRDPRRSVAKQRRRVTNAFIL